MGRKISSHILKVRELIESLEDPIAIAEIGVNTGALCNYILSTCGERIRHYCAVDPWRPYKGPGAGSLARVSENEWNKRHVRVCGLMQEHPALRVLRMDSSAAARSFPDGYFDLVFIDADHFYGEVRKDIEGWLPKVRTGGILAGHDYNKRSFPGVVMAVDERLPDAAVDRESMVWRIYVE